ncbi:MAG: nucleoside triphosphate pyrophosphohydrolase [Planctomycetota bacterium]
MSRSDLAESVTALAEVMTRLRRECPWDRVQTHASLRRYLLEEAYEVLEALDADDPEALRGELGDLLFQIWFHAEIASEPRGLGFDLVEVLDGVREKLVRRHPHVFAAEEAASGEEVQRNWERRKLDEGRRSRLDGIPAALPALLRAHTLQRKAAAVGFDWPDVEGAIAKTREELEEFLEARRESAGDEVGRRRVEAELGDLFFSLVNVARKLDLDAEAALLGTCRTFARRFAHVERGAAESGRDLEDLDLAEMDALWDAAKRAE